MYNGIGILTPRGSGTSGHVQTNKFNLRPGAAQRVDLRKLDETGPTQRQPNKGILDHNRKREIELEIAKLEEDLFEEGRSVEEVAEMVEKRRAALMAQIDSLSSHDAQKKLTAETHELAQRKVEQMEKLKSALGVSQDKEGDAFNRELQEERKQQRIAEREERELQKEKEARRREKEAKERAKAEKKRLKEEKKKQEEELERRQKLREEWQQRVAASEANRRGTGIGARGGVEDRDLRDHLGRRETWGAGYNRRELEQPRMYRKYEEPPERYQPGAGEEADDERWQGGDAAEDAKRRDHGVRGKGSKGGNTDADDDVRRGRSSHHVRGSEDDHAAPIRQVEGHKVGRPQAGAIDVPRNTRKLREEKVVGKKNKARRASPSSSSSSSSGSDSSSRSSSSDSDSSSSGSSSDSEAEDIKGRWTKTVIKERPQPPAPTKHGAEGHGMPPARPSRERDSSMREERDAPEAKRARHDSPDGGPRYDVERKDSQDKPSEKRQQGNGMDKREERQQGNGMDKREANGRHEYRSAGREDRNRIRSDDRSAGREDRNGVRSDDRSALQRSSEDRGGGREARGGDGRDNGNRGRRDLDRGDDRDNGNRGRRDLDRGDDRDNGNRGRRDLDRGDDRDNGNRGRRDLDRGDDRDNGNRGRRDLDRGDGRDEAIRRDPHGSDRGHRNRDNEDLPSRGGSRGDLRRGGSSERMGTRPSNRSVQEPARRKGGRSRSRSSSSSESSSSSSSDSGSSSSGSSSSDSDSSEDSRRRGR
ncbi:hypothetical protein CEUSTIGMA_g6475.t1 [Chlamydomonas eustigma]|uniref:CWF21 domain-containing protein n=1 Tax=Chlamydomonas eustigma TaxID=1157962 RepID=A0A250X7J9_9CHLO|nr:hypothetical protein CEUSTIGMA_g6475.t1 [Chlamydomonas eustigma]|eukprot:GAX79035.1 hypothetical protein CEUSTIGMA_g6475.t1 [Chlamydomonas eustigma]